LANSGTYGYYRVSDIFSSSSSVGLVDPRHNTAVNIIYSDGHAGATTTGLMVPSTAVYSVIKQDNCWDGK
jgi:prepilin-type processing-associated H-X9-DG protein